MSKNNRRASLVEPLEKMSDAQRDAFAAQFEREIPLDETQPLSAKERAEWEMRQLEDRRARRRSGGAMSAKRISVTLDRGLVGRLDRFAKERRMTRSELIAQALADVMKGAG